MQNPSSVAATIFFLNIAYYLNNKKSKEKLEDGM